MSEKLACCFTGAWDQRFLVVGYRYCPTSTTHLSALELFIPPPDALNTHNFKTGKMPCEPKLVALIHLVLIPQFPPYLSCPAPGSLPQLAPITRRCTPVKIFFKTSKNFWILIAKAVNRLITAGSREYAMIALICCCACSCE